MDSFANKLSAHLKLPKLSTKVIEDKYLEKIYANSNLRLDKLEYFGFDMDYTLAMYKSPEMEMLIFDLIKRRLVNVGYPKVFLDFNYNDAFPVRGIWYDIVHGNLLKVDTYGHILVATHGTKLMEQRETDCFYPTRHIELSRKDIAILSSVYSESVICILAMMVDYYTALGTQTENKNGIYVDDGKYIIFYRDIYFGVDSANEHIHAHKLKESTLVDIPRYLDRDAMIAPMLSRIRCFGGKTFLLTNSKYNYVDKIMSYLLNDGDISWQDYFDYIIIDAKKPDFFTTKEQHFRLVDEETKLTTLKCELDKLKTGKIYSGGSAIEFCRLTGVKTRSVIYIGDSIYGDILKSKKNSWKTLLIIPGLKKEIHQWWENHKSYKMLEGLDQIQKNELSAPGENNILHHKQIVNWVSCVYKCISRMIDANYGTLGSSFRSGSLHSYFFEQIKRFADLYSHSVTPLYYYLPSYFFHCTPLLLEHEIDGHSDYAIRPEDDMNVDFVELARELMTTYINNATLENIASRQKTLENLQSNVDSTDSEKEEL